VVLQARVHLEPGEPDPQERGHGAGTGEQNHNRKTQNPSSQVRRYSCVGRLPLQEEEELEEREELEELEEELKKEFFVVVVFPPLDDFK